MDDYTNRIAKKEFLIQNNIYQPWTLLGKGDAGKRVLTDLPPHSKIGVAMEVIYLDSWDSENFSIRIDGTEVIQLFSMPRFIHSTLRVGASGSLFAL
jgi:hypothetical protein